MVYYRAYKSSPVLRIEPRELIPRRPNPFRKDPF